MSNSQPSMKPDWTSFMTGEGESIETRLRPFLVWMPSDPRCKLCGSPFKGPGGVVARLFFDRRPSSINPHLCDACFREAEKHPGGVELVMSVLFADIRGSTALAEQMRPAEFSALINRFFQVSTEALREADAYIDRMIGDEVLGIFVPGIAGPQHARKAFQAARAILQGTGHGDPQGPWVPVGTGIHTGLAYIGTVGVKEGSIDITALGDSVNVAARLAAQAKAGEIVLSEETAQAARIDLAGSAMSEVQLKGRLEPVKVYVMKG